MDLNIHYSSVQSPGTTEEIVDMQDVPYHEAIGSLMYLALVTRPDITFVVSVLSCFGMNPGSVHWNAMK